MSHDDPRHGTTRGYHAGCREACCRAAMARNEKRRRLARLHGGGLVVPVLGAQRRIHALMRLGWTSTDIARACGWGSRNSVFRILKGQKGKPARYLELRTHRTLAAVYERLSMQLPDLTPQRHRTIALATRNAWQPPLAWDDIDDPRERPKGNYRPRTPKGLRYDEAAVLRLLDGENVPAVRADRNEAMRRWLATGRSERALCELLGWKTGRYGEPVPQVSRSSNGPVDVELQTVGRSGDDLRSAPNQLATSPGQRPTASKGRDRVTSLPAHADTKATGGAA